MMWNVCGLDDVECLWPGWCEIAVWCGTLWCDFKCFVVWIYKLCIAGSEQFALSVLCCVLCNVSLVLFMCQ